MTAPGRIGGSYRDPAGAVFEAGGRIFRGVVEAKRDEVADFLGSAFYARKAGIGIVETWPVAAEVARAAGLSAETVAAFGLWLEHRAVDMVSYPYEWSFEFLKAAALCHLELHLEALSHGYDLKDASAYNIQFRGCRPIFIDTLSFAPYREGTPWLGYKQFCEQFLAPLALDAVGGIAFNAPYRGALDGVGIVAASRGLPLRSFLSPTLLGHIHLQAWAMSRLNATRRSAPGKAASRHLPRKNYIALLESLHRFIARLEPRAGGYWKGYRHDTSYGEAGARDKAGIVAGFVRRAAAAGVLDIGCNAGYYAEAALAAGAARVIGIDTDGGALNEAAKTARAKGLNFMPLLIDVADPSPAQGWNLEERMSFPRRLRGIDATICLALIHHVVIGRNVTLRGFADWLVGLAPAGLVEFVPKADPMVAGLLAHREDVFPDYGEDAFLDALGRTANVTATHAIAGSARRLIEFARK